MKIYIENYFHDEDIRDDAWIFKKLPCLTDYPHGLENTSGIPNSSMRPYIEIDNLEQLFKLADDISNISYWYKLVIEPFGEICFYEDEITYEDE